eukprot:Gregarina_sp_Poly_1__4590@NODE_245_length_10761_cov_123_252572_g215_i0_p8_GENE_NODE_245_length_10761_cov_123_252572_g215_i0NODE_245_length_10761_cov_123_252572_g215_i0_p8_ORF_typecomplete_len121_score19_92Ldh_1_C/PF02866_18/8_7e17_NODE_245_length_10761_cov_123_252572_g215_i0966910031
MVLSGHGDEMVPLKNYTAVGGVPIRTLMAMKKLTPERLDEIVLLKPGSAFVAPGCSTIAMVESSYLRDEKRMVPCCAQTNGGYGLKGIYGGVPVVIGSKGVEQMIELPLDAERNRLLTRQ